MHDGEPEAVDAPRPGRWRLLAGFAVLIALAVLVVALWFAFHEDQPRVTGPLTSDAIPIVRAPAGPDRERPADPGGEVIPDRDKQVYETFQAPGDRAPAGVERLLPPPEQPLPERPVSRPPREQGPEPIGEDDDTTTVIVVEERPQPAPPVTVEQGTVSGAGTTQAVAVPKPMPVAEPEPTPKAEAPKAEPAAKPEPVAEPVSEPVSEPVAEPASAQPWVAQLAAFRDESSARQGWDAVRRRIPELVRGLEPDIQRADLGDRGIFYRLRTGGFADREAANAFCGTLKARGQACIAARR